MPHMAAESKTNTAPDDLFIIYTLSFKALMLVKNRNGLVTKAYRF